MEYKLITEDKYNDVIRHLRDSFFADEPLNRAAGLCCKGEGNPDLEEHSFMTLQDNLSIMAITEDGEIAGVVLNGILHPGDVERSKQKLDMCPDENFKKIFNLLYAQNLKVDFFSCFNVEKIFDLRILSVDSKFRGQGIAKELVRRSIELGKEYGFELMKADATGIYSQKILKSFNFEMFSEMLYENYQDDNGRPVLPVQLPHTKLQILYKALM